MNHYLSTKNIRDKKSISVLSTSSSSSSFKPNNGNNNNNNNKKTKNSKKMKLSTDPQSVAARERRHRISDRFKILQSMVPGASAGAGKTDTVSVLDEAIRYVMFLKAHIRELQSQPSSLIARDDITASDEGYLCLFQNECVSGYDLAMNPSQSLSLMALDDISSSEQGHFRHFRNDCVSGYDPGTALYSHLVPLSYSCRGVQNSLRSYVYND